MDADDAIIRLLTQFLTSRGSMLLRQIKEKRPDVAVILMTEPGDERLRQTVDPP